jgi:Cupin
MPGAPSCSEVRQCWRVICLRTTREQSATILLPNCLGWDGVGPGNFPMPPHTHPYSEVVTIISGVIGTSQGEKFEKKGELLKPGALWVYPAKHAHYAWTGNEESVLQVQFTGREVLTTSTRLTIRARNSCRRPA